jgi:tetratricopeptide (TPR) repeat protein
LSYIKEIAHALFEIVLKNKDPKLIEHDYIQVKKVLNIISEKKIIAAIPYEHVFTLKDKWANYCLTHKQNYAEALDEYLDLKKFLLSTKEDEEAENASTIYGIACSYYGLGDYDKALSTHLKCCKQRENLLEEDPIQVMFGC